MEFKHFRALYTMPIYTTWDQHNIILFPDTTKIRGEECYDAQDGTR